jgi:MFS family permease
MINESPQERETQVSETPNGSSLAPELKPVALWQIIMISTCYCGIYFCYSLQGVVIVPLLLSFGLTQSETSLVMLVSPLAVIFAYPIVGVLCDNSTSKFGRRKPYLIIGTLMQVTIIHALRNHHCAQNLIRE